MESWGIWNRGLESLRDESQRVPRRTGNLKDSRGKMVAYNFENLGSKMSQNECANCNEEDE